VQVGIIRLVTPEAEREYAEIRELLRQSAKRQAAFEAWSTESFKRANERMDRAEKRAELYEKRQKKRWEQADRRWKEAWEEADQRMAKSEKQLQATRKLVEAGMKMVMRITTRLDKVAKTQDAFLRSLRNGHNAGNGRNGAKRRT